MLLRRSAARAVQEYVRQVLLEKIIGESEQAAMREQAAAALAAPGGLGMRAGAGLQPPNVQQAHQASTPPLSCPGNRLLMYRNPLSCPGPRLLPGQVGLGWRRASAACRAAP